MAHNDRSLQHDNSRLNDEIGVAAQRGWRHCIAAVAVRTFNSLPDTTVFLSTNGLKIELLQLMGRAESVESPHIDTP